MSGVLLKLEYTVSRNPLNQIHISFLRTKLDYA